jgi:hypothetical protein
MCDVCSRRTWLAGVTATLAFGPQAYSNEKVRIACAVNKQDSSLGVTTSQSGDKNFDNAVIAELKHILRVIPVNPGFQYVNDDNAFSRDDVWVSGTKGTVLIGLKLVHDLLKPDEGGLSVACVLAHECSHIFQFFSDGRYYDRLLGPTQRLRELHADLLAGYYMQKRLGSAPNALRVVQKTMIDFGNYNSADPKDHGTPGQRNAALDKGFLLSSSGMTFEDAAREGEVYVRVL